MRDQPYKPEGLAERWQCSARYVRKLLENGSLKGFRLGKLWRIPACEVERYEACMVASSSEPTGESSALFGTTMQDVDNVVRLARQIGR